MVWQETVAWSLSMSKFYLAASELQIIHLVRAVFSAFALQVAGEVSMFAVLYNYHQWPWGERWRISADILIHLWGVRDTTCPKYTQMSVREHHGKKGNKTRALWDDSPAGFVQAPSRLTTLRWCPMWMRIFSSDIKARYSLDVAPSVTQSQNNV